MTSLRIETPSRLHFGLFGWGPHSPRQFGGVGLMVDQPGLIVSARPSRKWQASGPLADRAVKFAHRIDAQASERGFSGDPLFLEIHTAPREHVGLGTGTQLGLAVARLVLEQRGMTHPPVNLLARLAGRGLRSGIGLHGFGVGGLIVDGGRETASIGDPPMIPPLLASMKFPEDWAVLLVIPPLDAGFSGAAEIEAFRRLPPVSETTTDRLCRLVLMRLLPAVAEHDLKRFGHALTELQRQVGHCFAPVQGGIFAQPALELTAETVSREGLIGVGQSSWGPTLYGFSTDPPERRVEIATRLRRKLALNESQVFWTSASPHGARLVASE